MNRRERLRDNVVVAWVAFSAIAGYGSFLYAVFADRADSVRSIVNSVMGGGV